MWIILGLLFSMSVWGLDSYEQLFNVRILKVLPENVLLLDRGVEDGLQRNHHIKLGNETIGFGARAICIQARANTSYWKLYRVPNGRVFSKDYTYTITGLADREIPMPQAKIRDQRYQIDEVAPVVDAGPDPFAIRRDLPERLTERDLIDAVGPEKRRLFVERALDKDQLARDLTDYRFSIFASPFTRQSINQAETLRYGFRGGNIAAKYRLLTHFEQQQTKLTDPITEDSVSTRNTQGQAQFIIHRLSPAVSSLSLINYNSLRFGTLATPRSHWQVGPIGFTWHLFESKNWEYFDFSYVPLYDLRVTEVFEPDGSIGTSSITGLRHGMRLALKMRINERVAMENLLWVRPYQDLASWQIDTGDLNLVNDLKFIFNLAGNLFFDYNLIYQRDKLWNTLSGLPETNIINSLNLRYDFEL